MLERSIGGPFLGRFDRLLGVRARCAYAEGRPVGTGTGRRSCCAQICIQFFPRSAAWLSVGSVHRLPAQFPAAASAGPDPLLTSNAYPERGVASHLFELNIDVFQVIALPVNMRKSVRLVYRYFSRLRAIGMKIAEFPPWLRSTRWFACSSLRFGHSGSSDKIRAVNLPKAILNVPRVRKPLRSSRSISLGSRNCKSNSGR